MKTSDLMSRFDQLSANIQQLNQHLDQLRPSCWSQKSALELDQNIDDITKVKSLYADIWYQDGQDGRETRSCPGLVGTNTDIIELATQVNRSKDLFREAVQAIQGQRDTWHSLKSELNQRDKKLKESMHYQGLSRLHLKQAYRHIPILDAKPEKVGFSWYTGGRSIKRISVEEARNLLLKLDSQDQHILYQLNLLDQLPESEPLARVQTQAPVMRANIVFNRDHIPLRKAMNVSLPIIFPLPSGDAFPKHNIPQFSPPEHRDRLERSDLAIEKSAFLTSIRVHKYLKKPN